MAAKIKDLRNDMNWDDEILKKYGLISPLLSGRILEEEKDKLIEICRRKRTTQSDIIRTKLFELIKTQNINWDKVKILKGESLKGKTMSVRVKINEETEEIVKKMCRENKVTRSGLVRYIIVKILEEEEIE